MKLAIISDIHGNLPALTVILEAIKKENCDRIYCLGDSIAIGPHSFECLNLLFQTPNIKFVMGNHESYFINGLSEHMSVNEKYHQQFVADSLTLKLKEKIQGFPYLIQETLAGVSVAFVHYALNEGEQTFKPIEKNSSPQHLDQLFKELEADVVFYGHEHQSSQVRGKKHYINVGSSGCTMDHWTHYTIAEFKEKRYDITMRSICYDRQRVLKELEDKKIPDRAFIAKVFYGVKEF